MKAININIILFFFCLSAQGQLSFTYQMCREGHAHNDLYFIKYGVDSLEQRLYFDDRNKTELAMFLLNEKIISFTDFFGDNKLKIIKPSDLFCDNTGINFNLNSVSILSIGLQRGKIKSHSKIIFYIQDWYEQGMKAVCVPVKKSLKKLKKARVEDVIGKSEICILEL